jgi:hypothetical protein
MMLGFGILNFGHCDLFGICYLLFGDSGYSTTPVFLATLDYLDATDHAQLTSLLHLSISGRI